MSSALTPQQVSINFTQGLNTKADPYQLPIGQFSNLENSIFDKAGRLTKRNGYGALTSLPSSHYTSLTTFNSNLTAVGQNVSAYLSDVSAWISPSSIAPVTLDNVIPLVRNSTNQTYADACVGTNGVVCAVWTDADTGTPVVFYNLYDSVTGQALLSLPKVLPSASSTYTSARVFQVGNYFIILYTSGTVTLTAYAIPLNYNSASTQTPTSITIASTYGPATTVAFDGVVYQNTLYIAYNAAGSAGVNLTGLNSALVQSSVYPIDLAHTATMFAMGVDTTRQTIWTLYFNGSSSTYTFEVNPNFVVQTSATLALTQSNVSNLTCVAAPNASNVSTLYWFAGVTNTYSYNSVGTNFILTGNVLHGGTASGSTVCKRSLGLASKAVLLNGNVYFLGLYSSVYQPSYFLMSIVQAGTSASVVAKLAYSNGPSSYYVTGLPNMTVGTTGILQVPYLFRDLVQSINSAQGASNAGAGIYTQTGVQLATFLVNLFGTTSNTINYNIQTSEIGSTLNLSGGFIKSYDGQIATELGFFVWPDNVTAVWSATGGSIAAQPDGVTNANAYYYKVTYEWSDNQGNLYRSAPSLPIAVTTTGNGSAGSITVNVPTLRLTYKTSTTGATNYQNVVRIILYRWSVANQQYYQVYTAANIQSTQYNNPANDSTAIVDTLADSSIIGNNLLYTTGNVIEDIAPPASNIMTLFNNRLWLVDAEDQNLLWFSKQVIEATPVEMSDLLTLYVAPTIGSEGSTGPITALAPMDDKLVIFKENALGYINGVGPDNTGANNGYSDFTLINSVVGCINPQSVVFMPQGLMFQSNKGIWLLGRDLSTQYIGAAVEDFTTNATIQSALNIPSTNQVRFTLSSGITLMYDYYYSQWGTFTNVPSVSATIYQNLHTYVDTYGRVFQETPGTYSDNGSPVLMSATTGWINLAGVQGYQRFWDLYLLGTYFTPFLLCVSLAYNYNSSATSCTTVKPQAPTNNWGGENLWGSGDYWGGSGNVFEARVFPTKQQCESFQLTITEQYDPSYGVAAGEGLTLSGINLTVGVKRGRRLSDASKQFG